MARLYLYNKSANYDVATNAKIQRYSGNRSYDVATLNNINTSNDTAAQGQYATSTSNTYYIELSNSYSAVKNADYFRVRAYEVIFDYNAYGSLSAIDFCHEFIDGIASHNEVTDLGYVSFNSSCRTERESQTGKDSGTSIYAKFFVFEETFSKSFDNATSVVIPEITADNCSVTITDSSGVDVSSGFDSGNLVNLNVTLASGYAFQSLTAVFNNASGISTSREITDSSNLPLSIYPYDSLTVTATAKDSRTQYTIRTSLYNCAAIIYVNGVESTDLTYYNGDTIRVTLVYDKEKYSVNWKTSYVTNYDEKGSFTYFTSDTLTVTPDSTNRLFVKASCYLLLKNDFIRNYIVTSDDLALISENRFSYYSGEITTYFRDLAQYVIDFKRFYCTLPEYGTEPIKIGYYQIENSNCAVCDDLLVYLPLYSFETLQAANAFDIANTELKLFLPYIGIVSLDADLYMGNAFDIQYIVDVITGNCTATISIDGNVVETHNGVIAQKIPFNVDTRYTDVSSNNNLANSNNEIGLAIIKPTLQNAHYTADINKRGKISDFTGFCRFDNVDVSGLLCDYDTQTEIMDVLNKGVVL